MSLNRTSLIAGPGKVTWAGGTFFTQSDIVVPMEPNLYAIQTSAYGRIDDAQVDRVFRIPLLLWGAYENVSILFPSSVLNPNIGTRIYGSTDQPLVITGKEAGATNNIITFANAQLTKLADLYLGIDKGIFAAACEFTALLKNATNPEAANAYYAVSSGAFTDATFAKTNYKQQRYSAAWGAIGGYTAFQAHKGWNINWSLGLTPEYSANLGTVDMILTDFMAEASGIPVEPTLAQIDAASQLQGTALGGLMSAASADLAITGTGVGITLKNASLISAAPTWGAIPLRNGLHKWRTNVGFTTGTPAVRAIVA